MTSTTELSHRQIGYWLVFLVAALVVAWVPWFTDAAHELINLTMLDAFGIFATAKLINGAISVVQSVSVSVSVFAGLAIQPGEFLDPLNDLIESFSWMSLLALASLGMQKLLLLITSGKYFNVFLTLAAVALTASLLPRYRHHFEFSRRLLVCAFALRFIVPTTLLLSETADWLLLSEYRSASHDELIQSQAVLTSISDTYTVPDNTNATSPEEHEAASAAPSSSSPSSGSANSSTASTTAGTTTSPSVAIEPAETTRPAFTEDPIGYWNWEEPTTEVDPHDRDWQQIAQELEAFLSDEDALNQSLQATTVSVVDLTVIFLLQTLLIPLLFLFVVWRVMRKWWV
ncbi:MAG: hypothetical protein ABNH02_03825 [Pseudomonadales bacterium]|jgi:hypothetical protein